MESILAATHMTYGYPTTKELILRLYTDIIAKADLSELKDDYKTPLQEYYQGRGESIPEYIVLSKTGAAHNLSFEMAVKVGDDILGTGVGASKKIASQNAAKQALSRMKKP
jgi:ribonuclease-3